MGVVQEREVAMAAILWFVLVFLLAMWAANKFIFKVG